MKKERKQQEKIVKKLKKEIKSFKKLKVKVEETKQMQEERGDSSGDEGYKLQKKYRNYRYVITKIERRPSKRRRSKKDGGGSKSSSDEMEGMANLKKAGVYLTEIKYPLVRK